MSDRTKMILKRNNTFKQIQNIAEHYFKKNNLNSLYNLGKLKDELYKSNPEPTYSGLLCMASENGWLPVVKYLIEECGANVHISVNSPLRSACYGGHLPVVKYLIEEAGANYNAETDKGYNSLYWASRGSYLPVIKYLIQEVGVDLYVAELQWIIGIWDLSILKYMVLNHLLPLQKIRRNDYKEKIAALRLENWWWNINRRKKLENIKKLILPLYFHPEAKGGWFAKQSINLFYD